MTATISPSPAALLQTYPLMVTGQILAEIGTLQRNHATTRIDGTSPPTNRRPFARLHHTARFGAPR